MIVRNRLAWLGVVACVLAGHVAAAREPDWFAALSKDLGCLTEQGKIPGAVVLVAESGRIVYRHTVGYRDIASRTPISEDTLFRFYSMSKPITSVAVMMLVEEGKLSVNDPL